jgi:hypothetical protein
MTTDNAIKSVRDWILEKQPQFESLDGLEVLVNGDDETLDPPFIAIMETGVETFEQAGVTMHGVLTITLAIMLQSVPQPDGDGWTKEEHQTAASDLYNILANRDACSFCQFRNGVNLLDIRNVNPTTATQDGRRVTTLEMTIVACPNF